jgi:hypothetical protein
MRKALVAAILVALVVGSGGCAPEKKGGGELAAKKIRSVKRVPRTGHIVADTVRALQISRKGDLVAGIVDGNVRLFTSGGKELRSFSPPEQSRFERFFAAPDFTWFVAMSLSRSGPVLHFLDANLAEKNQISFSEDTLVTLSEISAVGDRVNVWTMESSGLAADYRKLRNLQGSEKAEEKEEARKLVAKLKRKFVARRMAYDRNGNEIWSMKIGDLSVDLTGTSETRNAFPGPLLPSPDGRYFLSQGTPGTNSDPENTVYDATTGKALFQIPLRENEHIIPRWASPEIGLYVFSVFGTDDPNSATYKVSRWDLNGRKLWEKDIPNVLEYANSGVTGRRIVMITSPPGKESDKSVLIWDESGNEAGAKSLDLLAELGKDYRISHTIAVDLSEDGQFFMFCGIYLVPSVLGGVAQPKGSVRDQGFFQCRVYDLNTGGIIFKTQSMNLQDESRYTGILGPSGTVLAEVRIPPPPKEGVTPDLPRKVTVTIYSY